MEPANEEACPVPLPQRLWLPSMKNPEQNDTVPPPRRDLSSTTTTTNKEQRPTSGEVPPYWGHYRDASRASQTSLDGSAGIALEDHTEDPNSDTSRGLWAKSVTVDDYVIVQGKTGVGAYVVWNCKIQTLEVRDSPAPPLPYHPRFVSDIPLTVVVGWYYDHSDEV